MQFTRENILAELSQRTSASTLVAERFKNLSVEQLNYKKSPASWSILECLEHLNLYGDFYIPHLSQIVANAQPAPSKELFKTGWLGNYFANSMIPKQGQIVNKMNTFKDKNPANSALTVATLDKFLSQQAQLSQLLEKASNLDLNGNRCPITLTRFMRLKLGDTFRFFVYHIERHILQATNVLK